MRPLLLVLVSLLYGLPLSAAVRLPKFFADHMVLQRRKPVPVWGWADAGERLTVRFNGQSKSVKAGKDGRWRVDLDPMEAGGPFALTVQAKSGTTTLADVLVGEVWICSGQSNMEMKVSGSANATEEIAQANHPRIRHFAVRRATALAPQTDVEGTWQVCSPATVGGFTAVGYQFAVALMQRLNVPIGLMHTSWGGTHSETWTSREALESDPELQKAAARIPAPNDTIRSIQNKPNLYGTLLYNAMLHPLIPMAMQGVIWYQGESNAGRAYQYRTAFPLMIEDWRRQWNRQLPSAGAFPFLFVQLASFSAKNGDSQTGSTWAELREAQAMTLRLPNTGMAVASDVGESKDIHPKDKKTVGLRLAAEALRVAYPTEGGGSDASRGPMFEQLSVSGREAVVKFRYVGMGLVARDKYGYLTGFEVAGADGKFHYAQARITGDSVVVVSPEVAAPVAVRYGWADDNKDVNLYNREGFPAVPFRTDTWKGITEQARF
ncbi:sialate O-acetylesterase [Rudanella lutea]|uniref:sialate O-acetylesterase n=1 Tax=Rudanella lutea TaxID=451374 RepID=UPI000369A842|nr:sialate O-acetylesterase [Rudanella lutea]